ncbi:hypothetical protein [Allorhizocola rhizosphaerae]|uniref:hypothetical protein n=1 Tax=Allorhizocola rhizosphaerae TaxID=1872709 RepID=UPI000E3ED644|nr:hypothetical protein [Allorhizocola rhizosphaerae]
MAYLIGAVVLIGLMAAANLLFTFGVVRRLREQTRELAELRGGRIAGGDVALTAGSPVGEFSATGVDGRPVSLAGLGDRPFVGFFSMGCSACHERLPAFLAFGAARPGGRDRLLAVVAGPAEEAVDLVRQLETVATVVVEAEGGPIQRAFEVTGFPAFVLVRDGVAEASGYDLTPVAERDSALLIEVA